MYHSILIVNIIIYSSKYLFSLYSKWLNPKRSLVAFHVFCFQVILIHLSNITGLKEDYGKKTMKLLLSDIGTICFGVSAAMAHKGPLKIILFFVGLVYGGNTFFTAATLYVEAYHMVPKGQCRNLVKMMAYLFYASWIMFPILFCLGPEGFGHLTVAGSAIGHTVADVMSKNLWGLFGNRLRNQVNQLIEVIYKQ